MDLIEARSDGNEQLLASGLAPDEADDVLDWWRYTKPFGPSVKVVVKEDTWSALGVCTTGTDAEVTLPLPPPPSVAEPIHPEIFVG